MTTAADPEVFAQSKPTALVYHAHPATLAPDAKLAAFRPGHALPPDWDRAARLLPLPAALDHAVVLRAAQSLADESLADESLADEPLADEPLADEPPPSVVEPSLQAEAVAAPALPVDAPPPPDVDAMPAPVEGAPPPPSVDALPAPAVVDPSVSPIAAAPQPAAPLVPKRRTRRVFWPVVAAVVVVVLGATGLIASRPRPVPKVEIAVSFKTPVMVLRASRGGSIASIAVKPGDVVLPASVLLTLEVPPPPDPIAIAAAERVDVAQHRVAALADAAQQPVPSTAAGRTRLNDLRHQRDLADAELASAQDSQARLPPPDPAEMPIVAGMHGVVLSVEAIAGAAATAGTPLIRMADCDHGYVSFDSVSTLNPGSLVEVQMPNQPPVPATVRPGSRVAGPGTALSEIAEPAPGAFATSCPLGASGTASPIPEAS